jgi:hypothetical protein
MTRSDADILTFIHARMVEVHGENPNYDYMLALARIRDAARPALSVPAPTLPMCTFPGCSCAGTLPAIPTDPS